MITYDYISKSKCFPGVKCLQCNDLEKEDAVEELYIVVTANKHEIKYIGMSHNYGSCRPTKGHNRKYNGHLRNLPNNYIIFRFKCNNALELERAGLEVIKDYNTGNKIFKNGAELTDNSIDAFNKICLTYNLKLNASSNKAQWGISRFQFYKDFQCSRKSVLRSV